jgi:hypothetical protein
MLNTSRLAALSKFRMSRFWLLMNLIVDDILIFRKQFVADGAESANTNGEVDPSAARRTASFVAPSCRLGGEYRLARPCPTIPGETKAGEAKKQHRPSRGFGNCGTHVNNELFAARHR